MKIHIGNTNSLYCSSFEFIQVRNISSRLLNKIPDCSFLMATFQTSPQWKITNILNKEEFCNIWKQMPGHAVSNTNSILKGNRKSDIYYAYISNWKLMLGTLIKKKCTKLKALIACTYLTILRYTLFQVNFCILSRVS